MLRTLIGLAGARIAGMEINKTIATPAAAAAIAASAMSSGATGRWGEIDGVWIALVTAQVMMTLAGVPRCPVSCPGKPRRRLGFHITNLDR